MAIYLQVRAGPLGLLLDALRIHEVLALDQPLRPDQPFAEWRGQVLPVVRLARHLELAEGTGAQAVVYAPVGDGPPVMLLLDEVARLRPLDAGQWQALPRVPSRTAQLFDAVCRDEQAQCELFRLRSDLSAQQLGAPVTAGSQTPEPQGH